MAKQAEKVIHASYGVLAVAITAGAVTLWGESWEVAVLGAAASSITILLADLGLDFARLRSAAIRQILDDRAFLEGFWIQRNIRALNGSSERENRFGIFSLTFDATIDSFLVEGSAYNKDGNEISSWSTLNGFGLQLAANRLSANYDFKGTKFTESQGSSEEREGNTHLNFSSHESGSGTVVHVKYPDQLKFDLRKITEEWLKAVHLPQIKPSLLADPDFQETFARKHAHTLAGPDAETP